MKQRYSIKNITNGELDGWFQTLYGGEAVEDQRFRWERMVSSFHQANGEEDVFLVTSPGRTELGGNHTDHNHGKVIAASIQLDQIAAVVPTSDRKVRFISEEYHHPMVIDLSDTEKRADETETAEGLIRGIAAWFVKHERRIGGFTAYATSDVGMGSGLSSSACFEVLVGQIFNTLYNDGNLTPEQLSIAGQWAENNYFEKPCGLMDQLACAVGGIIAIDFKNILDPSIDRIDYEFRKHGLRLCIVDTGGSHADLTSDYASVPKEMRCVASLLGGENLRDIDRTALLENIGKIREKCGDRALLRAFHFFDDCARVDRMLAALSSDDIADYLYCVTGSGSSSWRLLQNCVPTGAIMEQNVGVALALSEQILGVDGAVRVHGGGFAGTIQAYVPEKLYQNYSGAMGKQFGKQSVTELRIRPVGATFLS